VKESSHRNNSSAIRIKDGQNTRLREVDPSIESEPHSPALQFAERRKEEEIGKNNYICSVFKT
jgi:hypothetical protein